jgi:hypothetical protein
MDTNPSEPRCSSGETAVFLCAVMQSYPPCVREILVALRLRSYGALASANKFRGPRLFSSAKRALGYPEPQASGAIKANLLASDRWRSDAADAIFSTRAHPDHSPPRGGLPGKM